MFIFCRERTTMLGNFSNKNNRHFHLFFKNKFKVSENKNQIPTKQLFIIFKTQKCIPK